MFDMVLNMTTIINQFDKTLNQFISSVQFIGGIQFDKF